MYEEDTFVTFDGHEQFAKNQAILLSLDLFAETDADDERAIYPVFKSLLETLMGYQEQSYLLDPYLESMVVPVVERLKTHAKDCVLNPGRTESISRLGLIAELLYRFTKFRGYKAIIRFFPHEIADVSIVLEYLHLGKNPGTSQYHWALRYVLLLWLSLICMIPFDLAQLDEPESIGKTADTLEALGKSHLDNAGMEREGAAMLLSKLYVRKDTGSRFHDFVKWATAEFDKPNAVFIVIGIQQVLAEVVKSGPLHLIKAEKEAIMSILAAFDDHAPLKRNSVIRKYRAKILSRLALRLLPHVPSAGRRKKGRSLQGEMTEYEDVILEEVDVPDEVETVLEHMFEAVQDKETIVRWSAAKGVARIAENLPVDFSIQILETLMGHFAIHNIAELETSELPAIAEATWHGACLSCAEMARRNLVPESHMAELVGWLSKALYFDIRKGAHSIGSNVRDAAAYVLWALARTQDVPTLQPHANALASHLVSVAIYDREIHIRRAASAAFQEHVGRTNLFPHGIDVLGKTDFYSVSVRKHAFTVAAPQVARHQEYRSSLLHHVLGVVLRHWDVPMRELGAQSLRHMCSLDLEPMVAEALPKIAKLVESFDPIDVHGGILALVELGSAYQELITDISKRDKAHQILLAYLKRVPGDLLTAPRNHLVTAAACRLIATTLTKDEIESSAEERMPLWKKVIDVGMKHRQIVVQDAAAEAVGRYSLLADVSVYIVIKTLNSVTPSHVQSLAKIVGALDYTNNRNLSATVSKVLLDGLKPAAKPTIETKRDWLLAISLICKNILPKYPDLLRPPALADFIAALLNGLQDYSIDERGDVGSWARVASIQGLATITELIIAAVKSGAIDDAEAYLSPTQFQEILAAMLKQGIERLDNVRQEVGNCVVRLLKVSESSGPWDLAELAVLRELFTGAEAEHKEWADAAWLFPRAIKLLALPVFRDNVLSGAINSIGSKTDSTQKEMSKALAGYIKTLPTTSDEGSYSLLAFTDDLLGRISSNVTLNKIVIPVFQTFNVLLDEECFEEISEIDEGVERLQTLIGLTTRNTGQWKSVHRIQEAMKILVHLLVFKSLQQSNIHHIGGFLGHPFPKVRFETAEYFYLQIEGADYGLEDTEELESILLETRWASIDVEEAKIASERIVTVFREIS